VRGIGVAGQGEDVHIRAALLQPFLVADTSVALSSIHQQAEVANELMTDFAQQSIEVADARISTCPSEMPNAVAAAYPWR